MDEICKNRKSGLMPNGMQRLAMYFCSKIGI